MKSFMMLIGKHYLVTFVLLVYVLLLGHKIITHPTPFYDWDESIYVQVGKEMIREKSLVPLWQHQPWLEKPPLGPLVYGLILQLPIMPEISTRLFSLLFSIGILVLVYLWANRVVKNNLIATLITLGTAINPIFVQRAQTVNTDIFLLAGWLGYLLFFPRFWTSTFFLFLGVFSKSILGFYPLLLMVLLELFKFIRKETTQKKILPLIKIVTIQVVLMSLWFIVMYLYYKETFIQIHFTDHLVRRVTSSIESHFGQRTFYLDLVIAEYVYLLILAAVSMLLFARDYLAKKISSSHMVIALFFIPWFLFLNLTKTKISWYLYPVIPQIVLLLAYPLNLLNKKLITPVVVIFILFLGYKFIYTDKVLTSYYSQYNSFYYSSTYAKKHCDRLEVLVSSEDRKTHDVLTSLNLLISTSDTYGSHPSIFYYFGKPVQVYYDKNSFEQSIPNTPTNSCMLIEKNDRDSAVKYKLTLLKNQGDQYLYKKVAQ